MGKGCKVLFSDCDPTQAQDRELPNNSYLIEYLQDGMTKFDIAMGAKQVDIFDDYYDKYQNEEDLRKTVESLIRHEIQDVINDYVDDQEKSSSGGGFGVVPKDEDKELKVKISNEEVDKLIKEYKKIKKQEKSNMSEIKKLGLVDKFGNPL
jgi:hypothetical protein